MIQNCFLTEFSDKKTRGNEGYSPFWLRCPGTHAFLTRNMHDAAVSLISVRLPSCNQTALGIWSRSSNRSVQ